MVFELHHVLFPLTLPQWETPGARALAPGVLTANPSDRQHAARRFDGAGIPVQHGVQIPAVPELHLSFIRLDDAVAAERIQRLRGMGSTGRSPYTRTKTGSGCASAAGSGFGPEKR